ncbi:MAG: thiamine phosphate synthase, partial [Fimbriimonadaceae bacterium]|nr:thiamine phosphate synthase [Alphaproteobacteria bacterium]
YDLVNLTKKIVRGGVTMVQLRDKKGNVRDMIERARAVKQALEDSGVPLIINDRVDVALAVGADGVHLGLDDMPAAVARELLGDAAIIGETVHSIEEADMVAYGTIDYVGLGGVFATTSKTNKSAPIGIEGLQRIGARIRHHAPDMKICAIAGINADNAAEVIGAGADGVAVISALATDDDPAAAAAAIRAVVDKMLAKKES